MNDRVNMEFLKECLRVEVIGGKDKKFSWGRALRHAWRQPKRRFLFWWRIASYLHDKKGKRCDNVKIGAMTFVNKDIPDNNLYYTKKETVQVLREA